MWAEGFVVLHIDINISDELSARIQCGTRHKSSQNLLPLHITWTRYVKSYGHYDLHVITWTTCIVTKKSFAFCPQSLFVCILRTCRFRRVQKLAKRTISSDMSVQEFCMCASPYLKVLYVHTGDRGTVRLRCGATNRKVDGSIPADVIKIFHWHNPSDRTMNLGSTQPVTEMSTRRISWVKGGRCVRLTTLPPSCTVVTKSGNHNFLEPSGPFQARNGLLYLHTIIRMVP